MAFYDKAASILKLLLEKKGTIKSLIYKDDVDEKKRMFKVICEFLKYKEAVDSVIESSDILKEKGMHLNLARIFVYELLFTKGSSGNSKGKKIMIKNKQRLLQELEKLKLKLGVKENKDLIPQSLRNQVNLPRYIRVNTNKTTVEAVLAHFVALGFKHLESIPKSNAPLKSIRIDKHIPNLLVLPHSIDLHEDSLLLNGSIIIQDKASCFPAFILNPDPKSHVIDACAAPGNKTSHLSAIMKNKGHIFAFDADKRRLETLVKLTKRAECKNIEAIHGNFLETDPMDKKFDKVTCVLLDPSCSGSGITGRLDHLTEQQPNQSNSKITEKERLEQLAEFQYNALMHAFKFKNVKKVVYSTCSKHREENEDVVQRVLDLNTGFRLVKNVFPEWTRRGLPVIEGHENLIRTLPEEDQTIGFFVALFERV